jgi:uncharacterized protein (TIGR02246 family)
MRRFRVAVVAVSLLFPALALRAEPAKTDPARAAIEKVGTDFAAAYARGDYPAVARMYAEDAVAFPPDGDMVKGRAAIEALWKGAADTGIKSLEFEIVDVVSSGNLAAETGIATMHIQPAGQAAATAKVKYVVVYKKVGGAWLLYRDIWNSISAAAAAPAPTATPEAHHH